MGWPVVLIVVMVLASIAALVSVWRREDLRLPQRVGWSVLILGFFVSWPALVVEVGDGLRLGGLSLGTLVYGISWLTGVFERRSSGDSAGRQPAAPALLPTARRGRAG